MQAPPTSSQIMTTNVVQVTQPILDVTDNPAWKALHMWCIAHVVFEVIYVILAILALPHGIIWPILVLIGASNIACKCCCKQDGGKCQAKTMVILTSIALIGSFVDIALLSALQSHCNEWNVASHPVCQFVSTTLAFCVICLLLRIGSVFLAGRVCCGCCGAPEISKPVAFSAASLPTAHVPTIVTGSPIAPNDVKIDVPSKFCPACGHASTGATFCGNCGSGVGQK